MPDFNIRSDSINVEQIMEQIRARIREKRGVDYTETQIEELAAVKLERFLDPGSVRSDLLDQFRRAAPPPPRPNYAFGEETLFDTHRGPIRWIRRLLQPTTAIRPSGCAAPSCGGRDRTRIPAARRIWRARPA